MRLLFVLLIFAAAANAGEYVLFASGSRLRVDGHEAAGSKVRLRIGEGWAEMDATQVRGYEPEESVPSAPAPAVEPQASPEPQDLADRAADKCGLPRPLVRSVMAAESGFNPKAVSPKGAIGLMQLMPETARALGVDPHDPAQNVEAGACYLRDLLVRYDYQLWHALAAYNAGPQAVDRYGIPPYSETLGYIDRVTLGFLKQSPAPANKPKLAQ